MTTAQDGGKVVSLTHKQYNCMHNYLLARWNNVFSVNTNPVLQM
jgi:hypothetical protein